MQRAQQLKGKISDEALSKLIASGLKQSDGPKQVPVPGHDRPNLQENSPHGKRGPKRHKKIKGAEFVLEHFTKDRSDKQQEREKLVKELEVEMPA